MKKALIFGVSGQDGAYLAKFLLEKGYDVSGTSRDEQICLFTNLKTLGIRNKIKTYSASLTDFRSVIQVLDRVQPDEVYNLAGQSSVGLSFEQPVETFYSIGVGALNLLEAIRFLNPNIRLYNAASSECFGCTQGKPATVETPFSPRSPYAVAKAASYWEVANYRESYDLFACSGILFNHESPLRPVRFVTRKIINTACRIAQGSNEKLLLGNTDVERDWGWAPEYVEAMWLMLQHKTPEDFIIATGESNKLGHFVKIAFSELGLDYRNHVQLNPTLLRPSEVLVSRADTTKAQNILCWTAKNKMQDVVKMMIDHEIKSAQTMIL